MLPSTTQKHSQRLSENKKMLQHFQRRRKNKSSWPEFPLKWQKDSKMGPRSHSKDASSRSNTLSKYLPGKNAKYKKRSKILCTLQNTKNLPGKWCKKLFGTLPKRPHGLQIRLWTPSESKVSVEHPSGSQKDKFFLAGTAMEEAMDTPKSSPRASRRTQKIYSAECVPAGTIFFRFSTSDERFSEDN